MLNLKISAVATLALLVICCTNDSLTDDSGNDSGYIRVKPTILFKSGGITASPDSVERIALTVKYGNKSISDTFNFSEHKGIIEEIPVNTDFTLTIAGLDNNGNLIFSGNQSFTGRINDFSFTITAGKVSPVKPDNFTAEALSDTSIRLRWRDNSSNEDGFIIERRDDADTSWIVVKTPKTDDETALDKSGLDPNTIYYYRIYAQNAAGNSPVSIETPEKTLSTVILDTTKPLLDVDTRSGTVPHSKITITGTASDIKGISYVSVNNVQGATNSRNEFAIQIDLDEGLNTVVVTAVDGSQNTNRTSDTLYIIYDPTAQDITPPVIKIQSHSNNDVVNTLTPMIFGTILEDGGIKSFTVDNAAVVPDDNNSWQVEIEFDSAGKHEIVFKAVDNSDNISRDTLILFADTSGPDTVKPEITVAQITSGFLFNIASPTINIGISESGSGIDSVLINGVMAVQSGQNWSAKIILVPDTNWIIIIVLDKAGNRAKDSVMVVLNRNPVVSEKPADTSIVQGSAYRDRFRATDADGHSLLYFKKHGPDGLSINPSTGVIDWQASDTGTFLCSAYVIDKYEARVFTAWYILVLDSTTVNSPPAFSSKAADMRAEVPIASQYLDTVHATDDDGDKLFFTLLEGPDSVFLTDSIISWTPSPDDTGSISFKIKVSDLKGGYDTLSWEIFIPANLPPQFTSSPSNLTDTISVGSNYSNTISFFDDDGDPVAIQVLDKPANAILIGSTVNWTPVLGDTGTNVFHISISDGKGGKDSLNWTIFVSVPASTEPIAWFPFNGTANDESGNGNNGTVNGATLTSDRFGNSGSAYSFDGIDDYISLNSLPFLNFTVSVWIKTNSIPYSMGTVVSKLNGYQNRVDGFTLQIDANMPSSVALGNGSDWQGLNSYAKLEKNRWHFLAVTHDANSGQLISYIDGIRDTARAVTGFNDTSSPVFFGARPTDPIQYYLNGVIDDVRIYNTALSAEEITLGYKDGGWTGSQWITVGAPGFSADRAEYITIDIDNGIPYVSYSDHGNGRLATVMKFIGSSWEYVGPAGFSAGEPGFMDIEVYNGTPYVLYADTSYGGKNIVQKFNGNNWENVGPAGFSAGRIYHNDLEIYNDTVYAAYSDWLSEPYCATVMKLVGGNWELVGPRAFSDLTGYITFDIDQGVPFIAYPNSAMKFNGTSWSYAGNANFTAGNAKFMSLDVYEGTAYVAYQDEGNGDRATVMKLNGSTWENVGPAGFTPGMASYTSLIVENGTPYVSFTDHAYGSRKSVMKYTGSEWVYVGIPGFSTSGQLFKHTLAVYNGTPYIAYQDLENGTRATVMKYFDPNL